MEHEIKIPSVGESITTGVIVSWLKHNGDQVQEGDILFELETDKAVLEIPSMGEGTLEIAIEEGTEVSIGQTVARLVSGKAVASTVREASATAKKPCTVQVLSPAVRRVVSEHNLDPKSIQGTGKGGRIT